MKLLYLLLVLCAGCTQSLIRDQMIFGSDGYIYVRGKDGILHRAPVPQAPTHGVAQLKKTTRPQ